MEELNKTQIEEKLEKIYFPVIERDVFYQKQEDKTRFVKMKEYKAIIGLEKEFETQFAIVSSGYKLIHNKDFFGEIFKAIDDNFKVSDVDIKRNEGRFYVTFNTNLAVNETNFCLKVVNSYDTSASTSLNVYVKKNGLYLYFDTKSFKHKHTKGNPYVQRIDELGKSTKLIKSIEWIISSMETTQVDIETVIKPVKEKLPEYLLKAIRSASSGSVLDFYQDVTELIESNYNDVLRQIDLLKNLFESILKYIGYVEDLEVDIVTKIDIDKHIDEEELEFN